MSLVALIVGCGKTAGPDVPATAPLPAPTADAATVPSVDPEVAQAEARARAAWFPFELTPVQTTFGGDWAAFYRAKRAEEDALARDWQTHAAEYAHRSYQLGSADEVRGARVLQQEFELVARTRTDELRERAAAVLAEIAAGTFDGLARDCVYYGGPDREKLCLARLVENKAALVRAAGHFDPAVGFDSIDFEAPEPATGMVGQATLSFGPEVPAPTGSGNRYPSRHQVELWWSGQVMPDANGPVHHAPVTPGAAEGRWRFYEVVLPYSRKPSLRQ